LNLVFRQILWPPGRPGLDPAEDPLLHLRGQTDERLLDELCVLADQVVVAEQVLTSEPLLGKLGIQVTGDQAESEPAEDRSLIAYKNSHDLREKGGLVLDERLGGGVQRRDQQVTPLEVVSAGDRLAPDCR
jgi:hypothetical protein